MISGKFLIFPILLILFTSSIVPYSYASVESEAQEDIMAGCRDGHDLVFRFAYKDYVCVEPSTADRWEALGLAKPISESSTILEIEIPEIEIIETVEFPGAPPPAPKPTIVDSSDNSMCRDGQILIYQFSYRDTICTSTSTAITWERLGLAEIVNTLSEQDELPVEVILETSSEEELISEEESLKNTESENMSEFPQINQIEEGIWEIIDSDNTSSVLIEGNDGIIAINSLNSYESMKQVMGEFNTISDKKIKSIVLTTINPEILFALNAFLENGDGDVEIIINEELLETYEGDSDSVIKNSIPFSPEITLNVNGIKIVLVVAAGYASDHTYVFLPEIGGVIIGDSNHGVFPTVLDIEYLSELHD